MNRALRVARPALTIVVALVVSVVATATEAGGRSPLLVLRAVVVVVIGLAVALVIGAVLTALRERSEASCGRLLDLAAVGAAVWTVAAAATAFLLYLGQAPPLSDAAFGPGLVTFVFDVAVGRGWLVAAGLAALLTALLVGVRARRGVVALGVATVVAAVPVALQSATSGAALAEARSVDAAGLVQLVALGAWIGVVALRPARVVPLAAAGALLLGIGATVPSLVADGAVTPLSAAGAGAVLLAALVAVVGAVTRRGLRGAQLALLAAGVGLAAAGSVTRTSPHVPERSTPAEILTGSPLPASPTIGGLVASWQPDALWLVGAVALLAAYVVAVRRSATPWPAARAVSWVAGLVLLVWLTCGGPAVDGQVLVAIHLAQLAALLLVVPLLLAGGAPVRLLAEAFPGPATRAPRTVLGRPVPALVIVLAVPLLLSGTGLLRWSVADPVGTEAGAVACLLAGALLVRAIAAPGPRRRRAVVVAVLLLAETAGAVALGSSGALLAAEWFGAMGWGTDALAAQRSGAVLVWPITAAPSVILLVVALRSPAARPTPLARPQAVGP